MPGPALIAAPTHHDHASLPPGWQPGAGGEERRLARRIVETVVASVLGISPPRLKGRGPQTAEAVLARQIAMYLLHVAFRLPMIAVGEAFRRDRTTVTHACHMIEDGRDDPRFDQLIDELECAATAMRRARRLTACR
jgi:hypothetical protein